MPVPVTDPDPFADVVAAGAVPFPFIMTQISPVASELINSLPFLSHANPTGRKQEYESGRPMKVPCGQVVESVMVMMSVVLLLESGGAMGKPLEKVMRETL